MQAALMMENNADLVIRDDVTLGEVGPKDVRVKIGSSGVCHSDLSAMNGTIPLAPPAELRNALHCCCHEGICPMPFDQERAVQLLASLVSSRFPSRRRAGRPQLIDHASGNGRRERRVDALGDNRSCNNLLSLVERERQPSDASGALDREF